LHIIAYLTNAVETILTHLADTTPHDATATPTASRIPIATGAGSLDGWVHTNANDPSAGEKAALVGTTGTPAADNKYVTNADSRNTDARTPSAHAASHQNTGGDEVSTATPAANAIPKATAAGKLDGWISDAAAAVKGLVTLAGQLGGTAASPTVVGLTADAQAYTFTAWTDGQYLKRDGTTITSAAASGAGDQDIVGGRLDYPVTGSSPYDSIRYAFKYSNQIMLWSGTAWTLVKAAAEPTITNTDHIMGALTTTDIDHDIAYDVFAVYSDATTFTLTFAPFATSTYGASLRYSAWAAGTYNPGQRVSNDGNYYACINSTDKEPGTTADWANDWLDLGVTTLYPLAYQGLYQCDGRWTYGPNHAGTTDVDGRKYRWLGVILLYDDTGAHFRKSAYDLSISNYYNQEWAWVTAYNSTPSWTYTVAAFRNCNTGTGMTYGHFPVAVPQYPFCVASIAMLTSGAAYIGYAAVSFDTAGGVAGGVVTTNNTAYGIYVGTSPSAGPLVVGANILSICECGTTSGTITYYGNAASSYYSKVFLLT